MMSRGGRAGPTDFGVRTAARRLDVDGGAGPHFDQIAAAR